MTTPDEKLDNALASLAAPPPRTTDAAFARRVAEGVAARRTRSPFVFALPTAAAAAAAFALVVVVQGPSSHLTSDGGPLTTNTVNNTVNNTGVLLAVADDDDDDDDAFALPTLDGSSDEELERLDRALDEALRHD